MVIDVHRLRAEWIAQGYTNETFGDAIGVHRSTISRWLNGEDEKITVKTANIIVSVLHLDEPTAFKIFFALRFARDAN